jgi:Cu/Ag efflux pump CusA
MALNPGPGSVIYRGLAAVNIGGVVISLAFSLVLIPALMRLLASRARQAPAVLPAATEAVSP